MPINEITIIATITTNVTKMNLRRSLNAALGLQPTVAVPSYYRRTALLFDYTAYGDTVNTTARLESANKHLGTLVCVSEVAAQRCPQITFRPIGSVVVVGRREPIAVLEPVAADERAPKQVEKYREAFALMREHDPRLSDCSRNCKSSILKIRWYACTCSDWRTAKPGSFSALPANEPGPVRKGD